VVAGSPYYDAPVRSPQGTIAVTTPFDSAGRVIEYDIEVAHSAGLVPPGIVLDFAGSSSNIPAGFLVCNAVQVGRTAYPNLYSAIGTIYGAGDGVTTFNLPDCRGRTTIGAGQGPGLGAYVLGATLGEEYHKLTPAEMPSHSHAINEGAGHVHGVNDLGHIHAVYYSQFYPESFNQPPGQEGFSEVSFPPYDHPVPPSDGTSGTTTSGTGISIKPAVTGMSIQPSGGNGSHNTIQPSMVFNKIIKY
jgi:microcystin-dependent protein